jgi:hypothetical protein
MVDWRAPRKHVVMVLQGERSHLKTRPSASHTITIMKSSLNIDIVILEGWGQETIRVTDVALHNNCIKAIGLVLKSLNSARLSHTGLC